MTAARRRGRCPLVGAVVVVLLVVGATTACQVLPARTFVVDDAADQPDADPGDGTCATAAATCTLRAAVEEAEASGALVRTVVQLDGSTTYPVDRAVAGADTTATGDLDVHADVRIEGHGATVTGVERHRVFEVHEGHLRVEDLTIRDGRADVGAGVLNHARFSARRTTFEANSASGAGGTALHQDAGWGELLEVTVTGNPSAAAAGSLAGAVQITGGDLGILRSTIAENHGFSCDLSVPIGGWCRDDLGTGTDPSPLAATAGLVTSGGTVVVLTSTISSHRGPVTTPQCVVFPRPGCVGMIGAVVEGNGIVATGGRTLVDRSTLIGNRTDVAGAGAADVEAGGSAIAHCDGALESHGYNLGSDDTCFDGSQATDLPHGAFWIDPQLADHGGPTRTHLPYPPPVPNAIPVGTPGLCDEWVPVDQRGVPSGAGGGCERGAVDL